MSTYNAQTVEEAIEASGEAELLNLVNCPAYQADSEYIENCIEQKYTEQKG